MTYLSTARLAVLLLSPSYPSTQHTMSEFRLPCLDNVSAVHVFDVDQPAMDADVLADICTFYKIDDEGKHPMNLTAWVTGVPGSTASGLQAMLNADQQTGFREEGCLLCSLDCGTYRWDLRSQLESFQPAPGAELRSTINPCNTHGVDHHLFWRRGSYRLNNHLPPVPAARMTTGKLVSLNWRQGVKVITTLVLSRLPGDLDEVTVFDETIMRLDPGTCIVEHLAQFPLVYRDFCQPDSESASPDSGANTAEPIARNMKRDEVSLGLWHSSLPDTTNCHRGHTVCPLDRCVSTVDDLRSGSEGRYVVIWGPHQDAWVPTKAASIYWSMPTPAFA